MISDDLRQKCSDFARALMAKNVQDLQIYLSDFDEFKIAFFAALMANLKPTLLPKPIFSKDAFVLDDESFCSIKPLRGEILSLDEKSEFFLKTSGSSGASKSIKKSLAQMIAEASFLAENLGFSKYSKFISSVSHQHMFGLSFKLFLPLFLGASVQKDELNYPEIFFDADIKNAVFVASPVILKVLLKHQKVSELSRLKAIITAGSALDDETRRALKSVGVSKVIDVYGSSETGVIAQNVGDGLRLFTRVIAQISDSGTLVVNSPWCERFTSSDMARLSGEKLEILGRADRIIKLNDKRVSLSQIDKTLLLNPLLSDAHTAVLDEFKRACALICLSNAGIMEFRKSGKKGILKSINSTLSPEFKGVVRHFKIVPALPLNQQSKLPLSDFRQAFFDKFEPAFSEISCENGHKFKAKIEAGFYIFWGHFPDMPVVPGFIQLDFIYSLASKIGINLSSCALLENIKFTSFMRPNDEIEITLIKGKQKLSFEIYAANKKCASGRFVWVKDV